MPIYEYACKVCHREFEYQQRMSDPDKTVCEECGGELERLISRTAFQLKGSGWYKDLYSSSKPAETKAGESKPAETTSTTEAKPASTEVGSGTGTGTGTGTKESGGGGSGTSKAAAAAS
jgi:putative FmdB family regulatory protein